MDSSNRDPHLIVLPWVHMSQPFKLHLDRFSRFAGLTNLKNRLRKTDRLTDNAIAPSVAIALGLCSTCDAA